MNLQMLITTMNQQDHSLLDRMGIESDAIVANQCDRNEIEVFDYKGHNIKYLSFAERGVGLNRNNALMRADADICIVSDDDLVYVDGYVDKIIKCFKDNPNADVIIFNLIEKPRKRYVIEKSFKVSFRNFMRFGAARIAFRTKSVTKNGITFNLHFGGGAKYSAGEDTLFLHECLKKKLNIIAVPEFIASISESRDSTWFNGYTDKYFIDRGALFAGISKRWAWLLCLQYCLRHKKVFEKEKTIREAFKFMLQGTKEFKIYR